MSFSETLEKIKVAFVLSSGLALRGAAEGGQYPSVRRSRTLSTGRGALEHSLDRLQDLPPVHTKREDRRTVSSPSPRESSSKKVRTWG